MKKITMADLERNEKMEELCMSATCTMKEYLDVLEYENIFGQNNEKIESLKFLLQNDNFKNIRIV